MRRICRWMVFAAACLGSAAAGAQTTADRIWSGGPILTMNDQALRAEAVAEPAGGSSPSARRPRS